MPPKRTAKDCAPRGRQALSRTRSARTSKTTPVTDANDSDALSMRPAKRARGAASRVTKRDEDDDNLDNWGRASSKPSTIEEHLMDQNDKSKEFIQGFKEQVAGVRERTHNALAKLKQDLTQACSDNGKSTDLSLYSTQLETTSAAAQSTTPSTKDNPLFEQTQHLLRLSRAVLACHRTADRDSRTQQELLALPREMWKQDEEGMRKLLSYGKTFGEKAVEGWITPHCTVGVGDGVGEEQSDGAVDENGEEGLSEAENLARGLFEWRRGGRGLSREGEESWGVAARKQMVALAGVVRTLPPNKG
ncbi:hypothetical protein L209DRAFT_756194 [Thermothelomyces heterothallicus CBS 203.75]